MKKTTQPAVAWKPDHGASLFPAQYLQSEHLYESHAEAELREEVLGTVDSLVKTWIRGVAEHHGQPVDDASAAIYTFGSYRLGVHGPGVCVCAVEMEIACRLCACKHGGCQGRGPVAWGAQNGF